MKMDWFRFYHEALFDPKIQCLPGDLYKAWNNILCVASMQKERGTLPKISDLAFFLHTTEADAQTIVDDLVSRGLLDRTEGGLAPHNWVERQYDHSDAARRQKLYRDRHKGDQKSSPPATRGATDNVTRNITRDVSVTQRVTVDTETDTETERPTVVARGDADPDWDGEEPFASGGTPMPEPEALPVLNAEAEVKRVAAKADRLFPGLDFGVKVREVSGDVPMDHMDHALDVAHTGGKRDWRYIGGILKRLAREGLPKKPPAPTVARKNDPATPLYPRIVLDEATRAKYANPKKPTPLGEGVPSKAAGA